MFPNYSCSKKAAVLAFVGMVCVLCFKVKADNDRTPLTSPALVGIARLEGISYASLFDPETKEPFLLSTHQSRKGWALISVSSDDAINGPSAVIEKEGCAFLLRIDSSPSPIASLPAARSSIAVARFQATPSSLALVPPAGQSLPLVFRPIDPKLIQLTEEQKADLDRLQHDFLAAIEKNPVKDAASSDTDKALVTDPSSPPVLQTVRRWQTAQEQSDDMFRMLFGSQAFNQYQMALQSSP